MKSGRNLSAPRCARLFIIFFVAISFVQAAQSHAQSEAQATALEEALIERACNAIPAVTAPTSDTFLDCLKTQLDSLRADFGRDLERLSKNERNALDAACKSSRAVDGGDAYVRCIDGQLAAIRARRGRATSAPAPGDDASVAGAPAATADAVALPMPAPAPRSSSAALWISLTLVVAVAAAGGGFFVVKGRRGAAARTYACRVCGKDVPAEGELCAQCRHEAAEALRRATAERAEQDRAAAEAQRLGKSDDEGRRAKAQEEFEALERRHAEEARQQEEAARQRRQEEDEARERRRAEARHELSAEEVFDPRAILGVPPDAGKEAIEAAYQAAKAKYAPEQVAHLGPELQEHYKRKGEAVERAYGTLAAELQDPSSPMLF